MAFPTTLDTDFGTVVDNVDDVEASNINELRRAVEGIEGKVGINSSAVTASLDYKVNNFFVAGRKLYLYENVAPTGWSIVSVTDKVLAVKGGSNAYNVNGGNVAGTWTLPGHDGWDGNNLDGTTLGISTSTYRLIYWNQVPAIDHTGSNAFRPYAAVGIIIEKT